MRQFHYKILQLLQIATILLQNATVIKKCDVCYKLRQYIDDFNPLQPSVAFLYPLKISENLKVF